MPDREFYTPYYRTGGPARFSWHKCAAVIGLAAAREKQAEIERMGYKCLFMRTADLDIGGLPETWEVSDAVK